MKAILMPPEKGTLLKSKGTIHFREMGKGPVPAGHSWILKQNLMVSANREPTSEIVPAPFLPALQKFGHRCDGTGAVSGRQSHEKTVRRRARAAFFLLKSNLMGIGGSRAYITIVPVPPGTPK